MKFQIASDLHTEFEENRTFLHFQPIKPVAPILLLAGDIIVLKQAVNSIDFINYISSNWEQVYIVPGNHEFYGKGDVSNAFDLEHDLKNIKFVNHQKIEIGGCDVYFSTLWSRAQSGTEEVISDFKYCVYQDEEYSVEHHNHLHDKAINWLNTELSKPKTRPRVVVSHFVPCLAADAFPKPFDERSKIMKESEAGNTSSCLMTVSISPWVMPTVWYLLDRKSLRSSVINT
ncbi:metallophosphoesterase [Reichenbachiella agariperforans]|uniref:metallophosphoesterase n=1 Tax=Reichenbachiella agariperforans TaxID=156994 RepID=UPI001C098DBF|nr:metallophosphoesterase [Reichenbachiella agariperforans]MBU2914152.1 metallophosphoesterase [Reichenbachiella agariperforans]